MNQIIIAPPTVADVDAAARTIAPYAVRTPLLTSPALDALTGARVFLKPEMLQRTGSFKFRGAFNRLSAIPKEKRAAGVVAFSSGNHAQGVACAAQILGMPAAILMPADSPLLKRERTKGYGAEVILFDRYKENREQLGADLCAKRGATLVKPYDDPLIIAGQGTVGREIAEDLLALGVTPDMVSAPASGGGLVAGIALAMKAKFPNVEVIVGEPEAFNDHKLSLEAGKLVAHTEKGTTICDSLMAAIPGDITFAVNGKLASRAVLASDAEVGKAMAFAFREFKLVVEPGGAVPLAALMQGRMGAKENIKGKTVVIVMSGGNVDADLYAKLIQQ